MSLSRYAWLASQDLDLPSGLPFLHSVLLLYELMKAMDMELRSTGGTTTMSAYYRLKR